MDIGKLDERVELFGPTEPFDNGYTTRPGGHASEGKRWARYMPGTVSEVFEASGRETKMPAVFVVRRDTLTGSVNATWKLRHRAVTYDVSGTNLEGRGHIRITAIGTDDPGPES